jgi:hypothetical protein
MNEPNNDIFTEPNDPQMTRMARLADGVYFIDTISGPYIALHTVLTEPLSDMARELGEVRNDYLYYQFPTQAVPLYELTERNDELAKQIVTRDELRDVINKYYPHYFNADNNYAPEPGDDE